MFELDREIVSAKMVGGLVHVIFRSKDGTTYPADLLPKAYEALVAKLALLKTMTKEQIRLFDAYVSKQIEADLEEREFEDD